MVDFVQFLLSGITRGSIYGLVGVGFALIFDAIGSWGPWADAWIFTGSILATFGMARGWNEFWFIWIAVDIVGVPLLATARYYPSAFMYVFYGAFCLCGFVTWWRAQRAATNGTRH